MDPALGSCKSADGTRIAYSVHGDGAPLVYVPPWGASNIDLDWRRADIRAFFEHLARGRRLVRSVRRGVAESQREVSDVSMERQLEDLAAVVDELRLEKFDLFGDGDGACVCVAYAVAHPERVHRLVLWALYSRAGGAEHPSVRAMTDLCHTDFNEVCRMVAELNFPSGPAEARRWFSEYHRESESPAVAELYFRFVADLDIREHLPRLAAPTLVLHRRGDRLIPIRAGRSAASRIADARFVALEGDTHLMAMGDSAARDAITTFLAGRDVAVSERRVMPLRIVLFTDIVSHTEAMRRLGDDKGRQFLKKHEQLTREVLSDYDGSEIKTMGDGFLVSFASVTQAVECAIALQRTIAARNAWLPTLQDGAARPADPALQPLHIRVGLNAGEPIEDAGPDGRSDLFGSTVILAARIAAQAEAGEILATNVVRELCSGKPFLFSDRGEHAMKGFDEAVRVYEVNWRE